MVQDVPVSQGPQLGPVTASKNQLKVACGRYAADLCLPATRQRRVAHDDPATSSSPHLRSVAASEDGEKIVHCAAGLIFPAPRLRRVVQDHAAESDRPQLRPVAASEDGKE